MNILEKTSGIILLIAAVFSANSCIDRKDEPKDNLVNIDYQTIKPVTTQYIEVPDGKIAYLLRGTDTIGIMSESGLIQVPNDQNGPVTRAASDYEIVFEDVQGIPSVKRAELMFYTVMFEDSPVGDNDYNDLVIHVQQKFVTYGNGTSSASLKIQAVAMGNTVPLKLGADIYYVDAQGNMIKSGRFYFSDNVKSEMFKENNEAKMLRTWTVSSPYTPFRSIGTTVKHAYSLEDNSITYSAINYRENGSGMLPKKPNNGDMFFTNWFIENKAGNRFYAVPSYLTDKASWIARSGFPQGLILIDLHDPIYETSYGTVTGSEWLNYPLEATDIETTYPGFRDWIEGNGPAPDWLNPVPGTFFDAIGNNGGLSLFEIPQGDVNKD